MAAFIPDYAVENAVPWEPSLKCVHNAFQALVSVDFKDISQLISSLKWASAS